tara:strand:- start:431 stop:775 length:345 start_codon:yes stop_codon:yes gene_type:complete
MIKKKSKSDKKKKDDAIKKAEVDRRKRQKNKLKKDAAKSYYSSIKGYKGKGGGQNPKSKTFKEKQADKNRADIRDAARSGMTIVQMKTAGPIANVKKEIKALQKKLEKLSKGKK